MAHDTYDRRIQLGASRRRREDADALHNAGRWAGAIYMGGYTIECALKALICRNSGKNNFKETRVFQQGIRGDSLHNLILLLGSISEVQRAIETDRTNTYKPAWDLITKMWQKDELRYWDKLGSQQDSERFINAVRLLHSFLLAQQGEAS
ncbi:MAG: hypothetical protein HYR94_04855 [Chloroflexi bacterium]|nr:hypothetical protein [Chloroflexota bacterium]